MGKLLSFKNEKGFRISAKTQTKAEIIIYQEIGKDFWGDYLSAKQFRDKLDELPDSINEIDVRINSLGGDVFDGIAIYSSLKNHKATINVYIDGIAASIASVIAMAGDNIFITHGGTVMVHKPWTFAMGNARDLEDVINRLDDFEQRLITIYKNRTGRTRDEITDLLGALPDGTWLDAEQAVAKGFADVIMEEDAEPIAASIGQLPWLKGDYKNLNLPTREDKVKEAAQKLISKIEGKIARK